MSVWRPWTWRPVAPGGAEGVDDVVHLGSPGIGEVPGRPPGHAWVVEAAGDPVADTAWFGPDPNRMPGVTGLSAREVVLPDGRVLAESRGHGAYLTPGTTSAANVAASESPSEIPARAGARSGSPVT